MHYYKFNVKSWVADTSHLLPEEEGIYLRLTNHYYDKEESIPEDILPMLRKLRLTTYRDMVDRILQEFFILKDGYWIHQYCDKILEKYHKNAEKNRNNGMLGGRPPLEITQSKPKTNPVETHSEPSGLISKTQTKPTLVNHKPLTNNQEPKRKNGRFTPPSPEEVQKYLDEKGIKDFTGERFVNHYAAIDWMRGKNKIKSWKHCVATWMQNQPKTEEYGKGAL